MAVLSDAQREAGWTEHRLSDVIELIGGGTPKTTVEEYWNGSIPWLSVVDFSGDSRYVSHASKSITQLGLENSSTKLLNPGDLILSARGTVGELAQLTAPMAFNQSCFGIRSNFDGLAQNYLYYLLLTVIGELRQNSHGSIFSTVNRKTFESVDIVLPPLEEQERIAGILGSLDDKIEANTRLIQTLSDYCVALVDSLKLFEGSRESTLGEIIAFSPKVKKPAGEEYQFIDMSSLPTMGPVPETISSKSSWSGAKFENGDTLFARITPCLENGKTAIAMGLGDEPACGSTEFIIMRANTPEQVILPYGIARCDKFRQEAMSHMIGSTGRQRVKWQDLANIPVSVPSESDMQKIEKSSDIFGYFEALRKENLQLAETRDALIKRLIG